jgi:hypothetical protein
MFSTLSRILGEWSDWSSGRIREMLDTVEQIAVEPLLRLSTRAERGNLPRMLRFATEYSYEAIVPPLAGQFTGCRHFADTVGKIDPEPLVRAPHYLGPQERDFSTAFAAHRAVPALNSE